mmetsp:Transcript_139170/g.242197  ORF Transcript_139170/g.242197 Transcript_139170/m.242197 type:complete len:711 (-) Transcript_139170:173-2305(-)
MAVSGRMPASPWARALSAVFAALLLAASSASANGVKANPIGKVIELLKVLHDQTQKDAAAASTSYEENDKFLAAEISKSNKTIKDSTDTETDLVATLDQEKENRVKLSSDLEKHVSDVAKYENELTSAEATRKEARKLYLENEATYQQSIKQLEMAIEVMAKKQPDGGAGAGASLVEVASQLRKTLRQGQGKDFSLSTAQRETLRAFFEAAEQQAAAEKSRAASAPRRSRSGQALTPDFLQVREEPSASSSYGEYQSTTNSLQGTLNSLLTKVKEEMTAAQTKESLELGTYSDYVKELQASISTSQQALDDTKTALAASQEKSSQKEAELQEVQATLKAAKEYLTELETSRAAKEVEYKSMTQKRSDELTALQEAQKILFSDTAKGLIGDQTLGTVSFMQLKQVKHSSAESRAVKKLLQSATSPGLVLLALKARTHLAARHSTSGPFDKVKGMIKDMLVKLQSEQSEEAEHKAWCDKEMSKTDQTLARQDRERRTKTDRKVQAETELEQVSIDIDELTADIADMRAAMGTASEQRIKDKALAETQITKAKDGLELLDRAVKVLKKSYADTIDDAPDKMKNRLSAGKGVIAILEIAVEDFKELYEETYSKEETDSQEYNDMKQATAVKLASFEKSLEYKNQQKTKLDLYISEQKQDLTELEKEASATQTYVETLTKQCTITAPTYEERKTRREAELESLKNALAILKGEAL